MTTGEGPIDKAKQKLENVEEKIKEKLDEHRHDQTEHDPHEADETLQKATVSDV